MACGEELAKRSILRGYLIEEEDVEVRPDKLPTRSLDDEVDIKRLRKYFTEDAWVLVREVVSAKENDPRWMCPICSLDLDNIDSLTLGFWTGFTSNVWGNQPSRKQQNGSAQFAVMPPQRNKIK